jgi:hypothetical protein
MLGLLPETTYQAKLFAFNACGSTASKSLSFKTGALPSDLPAYTVTKLNPARGFVAFATGNYGIAIDNNGRIVWYHRFPNGPGLNFQPQPNGRYTARPAADPGTPGSWVEIDPLGNVTRKLGCAHDMPARLHDMIALGDGSYLILCDETRTVDLSAQGKPVNARVLGASIQHLSSTGTVMFEWSAFDYLPIDLKVLDPADLNGASINWTHANAIDIDVYGSVLVSFRNLNKIVKIDTQTRKIVWSLGGSSPDLKVYNAQVPVFVHQHGARFVGINQVQLLDNLGEQSGSRLEVYSIIDYYNEAALISSRFATDGVTAQIGGNTQRLFGGHTLVSFGNGASVEEYDAAGNLAWKLGGSPGYIFRAERITSLYRPGYGDPR